MIDKIIKRDGRVVPFDREKITFAILRAAVSVGGRDKAIAEGVAAQVVAIVSKRFDDARSSEKQGESDYPTVEEVQDTVEKVLIENGHAKTAKAFILYRYEHTLKRAGKESLTYSSENVPYRKLWETLAWAVDHNCHHLAGIREYVESGRYPELMAISEEFYQKEVDAAAAALSERLDDVRIMIIAGPSSSGKTTTTIKISEALPDRRLVPINVDHYFLNLDSHPQDSRGDYDFETPQALDVELLNEHLARLVAGDAVDIPFYNFKSGNREGVSSTLQLGRQDILLIDSLHGLFPQMTAAVPDEKKFKLYIETLAQVKDDSGRFLRWTDIRMLRRMVRDMQFRNYNPEQTLRHWYLVRRAELRYIVSRLRMAEVVVNSFMPAELPIMKGRLEHMFGSFVENLKDDPEKSDALDRAVRVQQMLSSVPGVDGEDDVPVRSLLREFIGGSEYEY
jgi:uridine kinase